MEKTEYPKINSLYKRDPEKGNNIILGDFSLPEFFYLKDLLWECTEKIDGTNTRVFFDGQTVSFGGRTDKAQMPVTLMERLHELFTVEKLQAAFPERDGEQPEVTLYGEGYGARIQAGGGDYIPDSVDFILFDVKVGEWWLSREACEKIAETLGIRIVPVIGYFTLAEAEQVVKQGFKSVIARQEREAEGLVCKPCFGLKLRNEQRIITKIKTADYRKLEAFEARK